MMAEDPWLTIIGLGEDGPEGLPPSSLAALNGAEIVMAPARHLALLGGTQQQTIPWPVPFADGIAQLLSLRGRRVVVLVSGDPFWFGAGSVLARELDRTEWTALPGVSCFALAAAKLGWPIETTPCLGLHAAPLSRLRPHLGNGARVIVTLRDGKAVTELAAYLAEIGFEGSTLHVMEALGGPRECISTLPVRDIGDRAFEHPVCVAAQVTGTGQSMPKTSGLADDWFDHDGQITKSPVRALTLSALAPRRDEHLWDIGGGSGSVAIEWLLADPTTRATSVEAEPERAKRIEMNAARLGVDRLKVVAGQAPDVLHDLPAPDAVFVGGGLSDDMLAFLQGLPSGTRLVSNAVTLETEALLTAAHAKHGGTLLRIELAHSAPLGAKRGWRASYPIVQWSVTL